MNTVFLDTVGLIGLWDEDDQWHEPAGAAMALLDSPSVRLVTTSLVLFECGNAAARRPYRFEVCHLWEELRRQGNLIVPTGEQIDASWAGYRLDVVGGGSIVDHVSFTIMRGLGINDVFSNDRHFKAAGFNTLF